jgi:signal transduction histidine kinase/CheY-like chemotaxis protein
MASKRTFALRSKVVIGFVLVFSALVVATVISYQSFTKLQQASNTISQPNLKIKRIDSILIAVTKTENTLQEYTLTKSQEKLNAYGDQVAEVQRIIESLESETQREEPTLDSVLNLLKNKLVSLEDFLAIEKQRDDINFYDQALSELEDEVSNLIAQQNSPHFLEDTAKQNIIIREDRQGFLKRLRSSLSKKKNNDPSPEIDTEEPATAITLAPDSVRQLLREVRNEQARKQNTIDRQELNYLQNNAQVMGSIYDLVGQLKEQEQARSQGRVAEARLAMDEAIIRIAIILVVAFLSTIVIVYLILADITRSDFYRSKLLAAKSRAERLARVKEDFLANMSHEIRTPLTAILGFTEQLKFSKLDHHQKQHVSALDSSSRHLLSLVNDILDFSKIEAGKINFESEPFDIVQIIREVKHDLQLMANQKELDLRYNIAGEDHRYVIGDAFRLKQILYNLVSNALKFTHRGEVLISANLHTLIHQQTQLTLEVVDTGIGISPSKQATIFDAFNQSDASTTRKYGGTGLGLAICKRLIEEQGGKLEVESEEGSGSVFRVIISYVPSEVPVTQAPAEVNEDISVDYTGSEALVIDDNPLNGTLLELALKARGVNTTCCLSGKEGLAAADEQVFDIVFCDLHMPEMDGAQVIQMLKTNPLVSAYNTPIIAFTANVQTEDRIRYEEIGVNDFLLKPFNQAQLDQLLHKHWTGQEIPEEGSLTPAVPQSVVSDPADFSLEQVRQFTGADTEALLSYLDTFVETAQQSKQQLQSALREQSLEDVSFYAHKLVSQVELLKSEPLTKQLKYLEQSSTQVSWSEEYATEVQLAIDQIGKLVQSVSTKVAELSTTSVGN